MKDSTKISDTVAQSHSNFHFQTAYALFIAFKTKIYNVTYESLLKSPVVSGLHY